VSNGQYLITGGAGFVGSHLVDSLLADGHRVVVLDNLSTGHLDNLDAAGCEAGFRFVQGSVTDEMIVDELVHQCTDVVHLAAAVGVRLVVEEPLRSFTTNVRGSEVVIEAAHRYRRRILVASTSEVYGKNAAHSLTEDADRVLGPPQIWRWAYSVAKSVDEILAYLYHQQRGMPTIVARFFKHRRPAPERGLRHGDPAPRAPSTGRRATHGIRRRPTDEWWGTSTAIGAPRRRPASGPAVDERPCDRSYIPRHRYRRVVDKNSRPRPYATC
jgi:GDP-D-mannose dehydratase